jgi:putative acetyltransferase
MDVDGELPELRNIALSFASWNGEFWVAERAGRVIGCVGYTPGPARARQPRGIELKKLYVERCERHQGIARELLALVEDAAAARQVDFIELWSDTRFLDAHRFYERKGYQRTPQTRELFDQSDTVELHFRKPG